MTSASPDPEVAWRSDDRDYFGYDETAPDDEYTVGPSSGAAAPQKKFASYEDDDFQEQNTSARDPAGYCVFHNRALAKQEYEQKICFWCDLPAYERYLRRRLDANPPIDSKKKKKDLKAAEKRQEEAHAAATKAVADWPKTKRAIEEINDKIAWQNAHPLPRPVEA